MAEPALKPCPCGNPTIRCEVVRFADPSAADPAKPYTIKYRAFCPQCWFAPIPDTYTHSVEAAIEFWNAF